MNDMICCVSLGCKTNHEVEDLQKSLSRNTYTPFTSMIYYINVLSPLMFLYDNSLGGEFFLSFPSEKVFCES